MTCKFCKHTGYIELTDGRKIGFCRKVAPKVEGRLCHDFQRKEEKLEIIQENLFELIDNTEKK